MTHSDFKLSFEFFPPKSLGQAFKLWSAIDTLAPLAPDFVSVTYGAGGSTRSLSKEAVGVISSQYDLPVLGHLTCVDAGKGEVLKTAMDYRAAGASGFVALRGDPQNGGAGFVPHPMGFSGSVQMIEALAAMDNGPIYVAAYPQKHPESRNLAADLVMLQTKLAAGASTAISQFFFEADDFLRFRDRCDKAGIKAPILPGILPIENWTKTRAFAARCGVSVPVWMDQAYRNAKTPDDVKTLSTAIATELCDDLLSEGVEHLHFYTLNDAGLSADICTALGRCASPKPLRVAS